MRTTSQELEELAERILRTLPDRRKLTRLAKNEKAGVVELTWSTRQFVVNPNLATFEVRGRTLMVTGASTLMNAALRTKDRHAKVLGAVIDAIRIAEDNLRGNPDKSFDLLDEVRNTLLKLAGKPKPDLGINQPPIVPILPLHRLPASETVAA